ncbi:MAG: amidase [Ignavibacteria bacterium RBG_13_36_8]|nr:MAG: amidase [Ignavibacteria bacterium RBG_13_36_8]
MTEPKLSVAILSAETIYFVLYGNYRIGNSQLRFVGKCRAECNGKIITISCGDKTLTFENEVTIKSVDLKSDSFIIHDVIIGKDFHWQRKENQRFTDSLKFIIEKKLLVAVNILSAEDYLVSVISSEMSSKSSLEFLKAHAIISRSWLITQIENRKNKTSRHHHESTNYQNENEIIKWYDREDHLRYDVCADDHCQRYQGITKILTDTARRAIEETRGLVLFYGNKTCNARYSKCCGGITESYENVWEPVPRDYLKSTYDFRFEPDDYNTDLKNDSAAEKWIRGKPKVFCNIANKKLLSNILLNYDQTTTDFFRWKVEYTQDELQNIIEEKSGQEFGDIIDLIPVERGFSGRMIKLKILGSNKSMIIGKELEIRRVLSKSHLYSSAFIVEKMKTTKEIPQKFILLGAGWGHGVGLCQIGAAVMSYFGYSFDEILTHYFNGATIKKVYQ